MRVLAFDCAGARCAAAILADGRIIASEIRESERGHAQFLMPLLAGMLEGVDFTFSDIDRFAVTTGPGSFTGIRVALAAARGLALGTGKPAVGVTVFEAMARAALPVIQLGQRLLVAVESRRDEIFVRLFDDKTAPIGDPAILAPHAVGRWAGDGAIVVAGDAASRVLPYLTGAAALDSAFAHVDAGTLAQIAAERPLGAPPVPFYLRPPDAAPNPGGRA